MQRHTEKMRTCYRCEKLGRPARHRVSEFTQRADGSFFSACKTCNREMQRDRARRLREEKTKA